MKTNVTPMKRLYAAAALLFMMFATVNTNAQTAFEEEVDDEAYTEPCDTCPIDGYVYAGIAAAGIIGYTVTRQKTATL